MKLSTACLVVAIVCYTNAELTAEQKEIIKKYHKECIGISGVNPDLVKQAIQGQFTENEKLKNHIFCVSKKIGFQNDAGEIQTDVLIEKSGAVLGDHALAEQLISTCAKRKSNNAADIAFQTVKCYFEETPNHISII